MKFTTKDTQLLKETYLNFLLNLKKFILLNTNVNDVEKHFNIISYLFKNGYLTTEQNMSLNSEYQNYLHITTDLSEGIHIMTGICCCRHANDFLNDILKLLGYDSKILYIYINENGDWNIKQNGCGSNHVAVSLINSKKRLILDLYNDFIFTIDELGNVITLNTELNVSDKENCHQFQDENNIKVISKTLKKYYQLKKYGIKHIYDDDYY